MIGQIPERQIEIKQAMSEIDKKTITNYDFRIGRTGRKGNSGTAYTLFTRTNAAKVNPDHISNCFAAKLSRAKPFYDNMKQYETIFPPGSGPDLSPH